IAGLIDKNAPGEVKAALKRLDDLLGVDLQGDLLGALGDKVVFYSSPGEGPLIFSYTFLFEIKDAKKLQDALDQVTRALINLGGNAWSVKKKPYRGTELVQFRFRQQGFPFLPTFAVHKGWLAVSFFPQAIMG